ncbi:MAG TPA: 2,3-bisphosphoglycerate-independent phosphoglycerate mutase [Candidatus Obscuribacterales bacterium]
MGPVTLLVLDGWGIATEQKGNAILQAKTPNYTDMLARFPHSQLDASGTAVGLPPGLMGNSEVGHLTIGAGRTVIQKLTIISQTIIDGSFFQNPVLTDAINFAKENGGAVHLFGLVSDGCVHSSPDHLDGLIELAARNNIKELIVHPILDGRDTPPRSAHKFMRELAKKLEGKGHIGVVCGRYYAMDRDNRWERNEKYWRALVLSEGEAATSAPSAVETSYERGISDEFVEPFVITKRPVRDGDSVICFNFRPDRVRQISRALTQKEFSGFARPCLPNIYYACLTEYDASLNLPVAFDPSTIPAQDITMTLPELLSCRHIGQLHTAETEKYAHVTYFLNGGREQATEGEERVLVPSLKVSTYDRAPAMQTPKVCEVACQAIRSGKYPFIVLNFANPDMVGHTGMMDAALQAVESVDEAFGKLMEETRKAKGVLLITADHGNVEQMIDLTTGEPHTAHTTNPVPLIVADFREDNKPVRNGTHLVDGTLADVAPTVLEIMNIAKPQEMLGRSLIRRQT